MHTPTDNVVISRLVLPMPTAESSLPDLRVTDCFICSGELQTMPVKDKELMTAD